MDVFARESEFEQGSIVLELIKYLQENDQELGLQESNVYHNFPVFKDLDGDVLLSEVLVASRKFGVIVIAVEKVADKEDALLSFASTAEVLDELHTTLYSRLLRNKSLRSSTVSLRFPITTAIYAPLVEPLEIESHEVDILYSLSSLRSFIHGLETTDMERITFLELISTIEGAKGLIKPRERKVDALPKNSKGVAAHEAEREIRAFDNHQKRAFMNVIVGPERIRGLAGSGKTVILAMKAAITHLKYPEARIAYTFYTKSLYQHVRHLITRFYRQYDDRDPDWDRLEVIHAWGGQLNPGLYYYACEYNNIPFLNYSQAASGSKHEPFAYACRQILASGSIKQLFDYILIDEGQDFPSEFFQLAVKLAISNKIVVAYDELQTIFQAKAPTSLEIFGANPATGQPQHEFIEDTILYKCYRNPREILITAHALGFGIYGSSIVQMLENAEHWQALGYNVTKGDFKEGEEIEIERPSENSLESISKIFSKEDIVRAYSYDKYAEELRETVRQIKADLVDGLRPDDILVITVDDLNAKKYLTDMQKLLDREGIKTNNIHADKYNLTEFQIPDHITLSTIHKAKGNEAYAVYVLGIDYLYTPYPTIRERNLMFTALTRAKGWVTVSGLGEPARLWVGEITKALANFPYLRFIYPTPKQLKIMRRDMTKGIVKKEKVQKMLNELLSVLDPEEIDLFIKQRLVKKGKKDDAI